MLRRLVIAAAVASLGAAAPASASSPLEEYQSTGRITPCNYSSGQLNASVPNDVAQYAPEYQSALQSAARQRASCAGASASGGSSGRGVAGGGSGGGASGSGSGSSKSAASGGGAAAASAAGIQRARQRARTRHRALVRARAHLAAATVAPEQIAADGRVPNWALLVAALPILGLLALAGAIRGREALGRAGDTGGSAAASAESEAMAAAPTPGVVSTGGNGNGNGAGNGREAGDRTSAEAPTEEVDALAPPREEVEGEPAPVKDGAKD